MLTTSLEISKRLYELSDWEGTSYQYTADLKGHFHDDTRAECRSCEFEFGAGGRPYYPAYDLGYLLRKLQKETWIDLEIICDFHTNNPYIVKVVEYDAIDGSHTIKYDIGRTETLEEAIGLLAIKLFEEGALK